MFLALVLVGCGPSTVEPKVEICGNEYDDDGDGLADCSDPECFSPECIEFCNDGQDNDLDGLADCDDPSCDGKGCAENCDDTRDNDKDGLRDCADPDCNPICDVDADGHLNYARGGDDCDDENPDVHPNNLEVCDGFDNDCNGLTDLEDPLLDQDTLTTWYRDADGDGFGTLADSVVECFAPPEYILLDGDCNDADFYVNPVALELCDGIDNDCDTLSDDDDPSVDMASATTWYDDLDGDGYGVPGPGVFACAPPPDSAPNTSDCDDTDRTIADFGNWILDVDGDTYGSGVPQGPPGCVPPGPNWVSEHTPIDCDESNPAINPGAPDPCGDGQDMNCDGVDCTVWFDGFELGSFSNLWTTSGNQPWQVAPGVGRSGAYGAQSGNIGNSQDSSMSVSVFFPAGGSIDFWHHGDTETNYDFLELWVDGSKVWSKSGFWGWTFLAQPVVAGLHDIEFRYYKDASVSVGADRVWVDDITMTGAVP